MADGKPKVEEPTSKDAEDQTANPAEPWAPSGMDQVGRAPREGQEGERGTSAFDGDGPSDERGPAAGRDYHADNPGLRNAEVGIRENGREDASSTS